MSNVTNFVTTLNFNTIRVHYNISSELCTIATVLDPRLKLDFYKDGSENGGENPTDIREYVKLFYNSTYVTPEPGLHCQPATKKRKLVVFRRKTSSTSTSELDTYLDEPLIDGGHNFALLEYWRVHSTRFPNLSRMARDYLAVPGTSTPSERVFSAGRQLITDFRCRLKAETITACMLIRLVQVPRRCFRSLYSTIKYIRLLYSI
jgi:hAT family C-terminal dimerisation region